MVKLMCALMIIAGGTYIGFGEVRTLKYRVRLLRQFSESINYIKSEISFTLAPVNCIFKWLSCSGGRAIRSFYGECLEYMSSEMPLDEIWECSLRHHFYDKLRGDELECICEVGRVLGRSDAESQCKALESLHERMGRYVRSAEDDRMRLGKLYCAMGAFVSAGIVIVLI